MLVLKVIFRYSRDTYLLYPGYKTYYIDDEDAWDASGIPQTNQNFVVPEHTIIKITKEV